MVQSNPGNAITDIAYERNAIRWYAGRPWISQA
jgi:hypothetical protein